MPKDFSRTDRVASVIHHELAQFIEFELRRSDYGLITITGVEVSPDLSHAKIYIVTHDEAKTDLALKRLKEISRELRYHLGKKISLKKMPELHFFHDKSIAEGSRISQLLNQ